MEGGLCELNINNTSMIFERRSAYTDSGGGITNLLMLDNAMSSRKEQRAEINTQCLQNTYLAAFFNNVNDTSRKSGGCNNDDFCSCYGGGRTWIRSDVPVELN